METSFDLYDGLKDSEALELFEAMYYQLSMLPLDEAANPKLNSLRSRVLLKMELMEEEHWLPRTATISDYKAKEPFEYDGMLELIKEAKRDFRICPILEW